MFLTLQQMYHQFHIVILQKLNIKSEKKEQCGNTVLLILAVDQIFFLALD